MQVISHWRSKVETGNWFMQKHSAANLDMQVLPSYDSNSIRKSSHKRSYLPTFSQWSSVWEESRTFLLLYSTCKYFSFPWVTSASSRLSGRQCYFRLCHIEHHVCFSSDADQFNFTLETSASVSDKRARERTHWSMGSGTDCQQGKAPRNNKYVHINIHGILQRCLDMSGWLPSQASMPPTYSQRSVYKKICKVVILCVSGSECIWISRWVVWSRISGRCLWRCGAQLERKTLHILTWPISA